MNIATRMHAEKTAAARVSHRQDVAL
jgi:hypothetical protein